MFVKKILLALSILAGLVTAGETSWKTFDVKIGPYIAEHSDYSTSAFGLNLQIVKPITPYLAAGITFDVNSALTSATDCNQYKFKELNEGLLIHFNVPLAKYVSLTSNFMFLVMFRDGTVDYSNGGVLYVIDAFDMDGNEIKVYPRENDDEDGDFYEESFAFRSNIGIKFHTLSERFGIEFYPIDFQIEATTRYTISLNAVFRVF